MEAPGHIYMGGNVNSWAHYGFKVLGQKCSLHGAKPAEVGAVGNSAPRLPADLGNYEDEQKGHYLPPTKFP